MQNRGDLSRVMTHLTRDDRDTDENGQPARDNFLQMLSVREITAIRPHCLHRKQIRDVHKHKFRVCCFTECPLTYIKHMIGYMPGRRIQLESYGFVFKRDFVLQAGAQMVVPVNSYGADKRVREGYDKIFEVALAGKFSGVRWTVLPFLSAMHDNYDFGWEREFRHLGDFKFEYSDLVCAIVPDDDDVEIREKLAKLAIPAVCPEWGMEEMIESFRVQQRRTKRLVAPPKPIVKPVIKVPKPIQRAIR